MTRSMRAAPVCLASLVLLGPNLAFAQHAPLARAATSQEATSLPSAATPSSHVALSPSDTALPIPPLPNRVDSVLPSWLRVRGEFRERFEGFDNGNFIDGRDDYYALSRVRLNAILTASRSVSFQAGVQDARVAGKTSGPTTAPFRGPFDVRTAFADIGDANARIAFRLGRQELEFGEQRLLGNLSWVNTGRRWDAARVILRSTMFQAKVFGASLVRSLPDEFDKSGDGNRLAGVYATSARSCPTRRSSHSSSSIATRVNTHVGQEIDLQVTRALTPQIQLAAGYAHVFTGALLKQATPGASYSQPYVMVTYVFLAEK